MRTIMSESQFIANKYYRWYTRICAGWPCAKDRPDDPMEGHHILPRCMGGGRGSNIVALSYRKHLIAHWLLTKCARGTDRVKMLAALHCLTRKSNPHGGSV